MKMKSWLGSLLLVGGLLFTGCQNEEAPAVKFAVNELVSGDSLTVFPGQQLALSYSAENMTNLEVGTLPDNWKAEVDPQSSKILITAPVAEAREGVYPVILLANGNGSVASFTVMVELEMYDRSKGVFVLNEGNMTTENGSLSYISPSGTVVADAYKTSNGTELGNVCQDMSVSGGLLYIISQNGDLAPTGAQFNNDGMLVIADARTLQKKNAFSRAELAQLEWPTHIAALDKQHVYIRDKKGIWRLDTESRQLTFVEGSEGAPQAPFVVMNGKIYTYYSSSYLGYIWEISPDADQISKIRLPMYGTKYDINSVLGIRAAGENEFWVIAHGFGNYSVGKYNLETKKIVQKRIEGAPDVASSGAIFTTSGNQFYYASGTTIFKVSFDDEASGEEFFADVNSFGNKARMLYNGIAVHPVTGKLYVNTIKEYQTYTENNIWVVDVAAQDTVAHYDNVTRFPAGFYFSESANINNIRH